MGRQWGEWENKFSLIILDLEIFNFIIIKDFLGIISYLKKRLIILDLVFLNSMIN